MLEERRDTVEITRVETERVLVDERRDLGDVARVAGHGRQRIGMVAHPRTLPECTLVHPASSIS